MCGCSWPARWQTAWHLLKGADRSESGGPDFGLGWEETDLSSRAWAPGSSSRIQHLGFLGRKQPSPEKACLTFPPSWKTIRPCKNAFPSPDQISKKAERSPIRPEKKRNSHPPFISNTDTSQRSNQTELRTSKPDDITSSVLAGKSRILVCRLRTLPVHEILTCGGYGGWRRGMAVASGKTPRTVKSRSMASASIVTSGRAFSSGSNILTSMEPRAPRHRCIILSTFLQAS